MENKTGKYFKYAIGEIVLVVIGILIALGINNWNENRKATIVENNLVLNIIAELKSAKKELEEDLNTNQQILEKMSEYLDDDFPESEKGKSNILFLAAHNNINLNISLVISVLENNVSNSSSDSELLKKLRDLNSLNENLVKTESFLDELWNSKTIEFLIDKKYAYSTLDKFLRKSIRNGENSRELYDDVEYKNIIAVKWLLHDQWVSYQVAILKKKEEILEYLNR